MSQFSWTINTCEKEKAIVPAAINKPAAVKEAAAILFLIHSSLFESSSKHLRTSGAPSAVAAAASPSPRSHFFEASAR